MRDFIRWVITRRENTKDVARQRLQVALIRDRMDLSPDIMDALKTDMLAVMSRYLSVGDDFQEFGIRRLDESVFLVSNIKVRELPRAAAMN
jgi:cell division topological specificity factor